MTLTELKTKANTKLTTFWDMLALKQEAYLLKHGDYFQLLTSPVLPVVDGIDSDFTVQIPSDLTLRTIDIDIPFTEKIPFQIAVNAWGNNEAKGYNAVVIVELPDGRRFTRSRELTDPRVRTQDYDTQEMPQPVGDLYYVGSTSIVTSPWEEITNETI